MSRDLRRAMRGRWAVVATFVCCALAGAAFALAACKRSDPFPCGKSIGSSKIATCNGAGEICVCSTHRCARPDTMCPRTDGFARFRYVFGEEECVARAEVDPFVAAGATASNALCANQVRTPTCGIPTSGKSTPVNCPDGEYCVCGTELRCAVLDPECKGTGFKWADEPRMCVDAAAVGGSGRFVRNVVSKNQFCPGYRRRVSCGHLGDGGTFAKCGGGSACSCTLGACVFPDTSCNRADENGWAYSGSHICATGVTDIVATFTASTAGACPGNAIPDAGPDAKAEDAKAKDAKAKDAKAKAKDAKPGDAKAKDASKGDTK